MTTAVVGVDGSENSLAALAFAAEFVGPGGVVHVVAVGHRADDRDLLEQQWLGSPSDGDVELQLHLVGHDPADVIVEFADAGHADLIAIGTHSGLPGIPKGVGQVTHKILRNAGRPVAALKAPWSPAPAEAPLVAGVGNGPPTHAAVAWAAGQARRQQRPLHLVRSINRHPRFGLADTAEAVAAYIAPELLVDWAQGELDLRQEQAREIGIEPEVTLASGHAGPRLVEAADGAAALVIGKHYDGRLTGYFTSRCVHHALTHATCPVIVVPQSMDDLDPTTYSDEPGADVR